MEIQQESMGFDNGDSGQDAITKMNEEQCQQAISRLEYYAEKFEKYVDALRQLEDHRRESGDIQNRTFQLLLDYNLDGLCNENYFFFAAPERKRLSNAEVLETLRIGIITNRRLHFEKYILFFCITSNYLVAMYEMLYDRTDFRYSQAFLYEAVKKFESNKYKDQVETAANKIHAAKQIFKEIWPRIEMDNLINLRKGPDDLVIKRPYATSQNWTSKMYISEYRNVRIFHKLDGLKLNSKALFQQFNRISRIFADEAALRFADAKRRKEEEQLREAEERRLKLEKRREKEAAKKAKSSVQPSTKPSELRKRKIEEEEEVDDSDELHEQKEEVQQPRPKPRNKSNKPYENEKEEEVDDSDEPHKQKEEEVQQETRPKLRKLLKSNKHHEREEQEEQEEEKEEVQEVQQQSRPKPHKLQTSNKHHEGEEQEQEEEQEEEEQEKEQEQEKEEEQEQEQEEVLEVQQQPSSFSTRWRATL